MTHAEENRPVLDMETVIRDKFAAGEGVVCLPADMDDTAVLAAIKAAAAYGVPFQVIPPPKADGRGIGSYSITVNQTSADFEKVFNMQ